MIGSIDDQITEGDRVTVYWENVQTVFDVEVLHAAQGAGDVWILKEKDLLNAEHEIVRRGPVHYVMTYSRITKTFSSLK